MDEHEQDETQMVVITDGKWHDFKHRDDVPADVWADRFGYLKGENFMDYYFKYRDWWYHLSDFLTFDKGSKFAEKGWHGYSADTYFSGVVIAMHAYDDKYKVGRYMV